MCICMHTQISIYLFIYMYVSLQEFTHTYIHILHIFFYLFIIFSHFSHATKFVLMSVFLSSLSLCKLCIQTYIHICLIRLYAFVYEVGNICILNCIVNSLFCLLFLLLLSLFLHILIFFYFIIFTILLHMYGRIRVH